MTPRLDRLTAWLCLVLACFCGLTPAQGFVLCIEADGCVRVELKAADMGCAGCEGHEPATGIEEGTGGELCPCVDLAVPGEPESTQLRQRTSLASQELGLALASVSSAFASAPCARPAPAAPRVPPRPPALWAQLRSVTLRN